MRPESVARQTFARLSFTVCVVGALVTVASLWSAWAVAGSDSRSGWAWMQYGDVLLALSAACVVVCAAAVHANRVSDKSATPAVVVALATIAACAAGVVAVSFLTDLSFPTDADEDAGRPSFTSGPGPDRAGLGLALMLGGVVGLAVASRRREAVADSIE